MKSIYYLRIECDTLSEVEGYIKRNGIFPDIVVIMAMFLRDHKNTKTLLMRCMSVTNIILMMIDVTE